jgi:serine/threonine protein kinase
VEDQLELIFDTLGVPTIEHWPDMPSLPNYKGPYAPRQPRGLRGAVPHMPPPGIALLGQMLQFNPDARISAAEALEHDLFAKKKGGAAGAAAAAAPPDAAGAGAMRQ